RVSADHRIQNSRGIKGRVHPPQPLFTAIDGHNVLGEGHAGWYEPAAPLPPLRLLRHHLPGHRTKECTPLAPFSLPFLPRPRFILEPHHALEPLPPQLPQHPPGIAIARPPRPVLHRGLADVLEVQADDVPLQLLQALDRHQPGPYPVPRVGARPAPIPPPL